MAKKPTPLKAAASVAASLSPSQATDVGAAAELPYAIIQYASHNNLLYPLDASAGTTATLAVPPGGGDVKFYWAIKDLAEPTFAPLELSGTNVVDIPWQWVSRCTGHTVLIWYTAMVSGVLRHSLVLELEIQYPREQDLVVSRPVFVHAALEWGTKWLNMFNFSGDETITVEAWPMIQEGDSIFLTVAGDQLQVPYSFIWVAYNYVVTQAEAHAGHVFQFRLPRAWLARRQDYSALTTHLGVIRDLSSPIAPDPADPHLENPLPVNVQDFHLRTTTLLRTDPALDLPAPHIKEAADGGAAGWLINPANTVDGAHIVISYEGMHAGDIVCPQFAGTPGPGSPPLVCHTVQPGETSLEFAVPPSAISANFDKPVTVTYTVSHSGIGPWASPPFVASVLGLSRLPTPQVQEATGNVLDLNTFVGDATCTVEPWYYIALEQHCWMWVTGTLADGRPVSMTVLEAEPVNRSWLTEGASALLARSELEKLADCSEISSHFAVSFNGAVNRADAVEFPVRWLHLVQEALVLDAPRVLEAVGSELTVWNGRDGVTVRVAYARMSPRHEIQVCWRGQDGTCLPLAPKPGNLDPGYVDFRIPVEAVIHGIGKTVAISYTVSSECKFAPSAALPLRISVPVRLPTPKVVQATAGVLDLRTFTRDATVTVENWWFMLAGQKGWLTCTGIKEDGAAYSIRVMVAEDISATDVANGLSRVLERAELEKFRDKSSVKIVFEVTPDGSSKPSDAVVFPELELAFRKHYRDLTSFNNQSLGKWRIGYGAPDPRDISFQYLGVGPDGKPDYVVKNYTYSAENICPILLRTFDDLENGHTYQFAAKACRFNSANPTPKLSLREGSVDKTQVVELIQPMVWVTLKFTFVAGEAPVTLAIYSHERDSRRSGNDYLMTDLLVEEVV
ncbi:MAG: hypothetical protein GAK37_03461 [Pseudomonas sp.]|nr:MAG: hypothetical protein GAK37_03461 [Pseudomonas sp.]